MSFPYIRDDPQEIGYKIGRQIIGLYIVKMLFKYALDNAGIEHGKHHNLHHLFMYLLNDRRKAVEQKYKEILNSQLKETWDVANSVDSLLKYLGKNPITDTRYFWEPRHDEYKLISTLIMPEVIYTLLYSLFIILHDYPSQPIIKRYNTTFRSLVGSLKEITPPT